MPCHLSSVPVFSRKLRELVHGLITSINRSRDPATYHNCSDLLLDAIVITIIQSGGLTPYHLGSDPALNRQ